MNELESLHIDKNSERFEKRILNLIEKNDRIKASNLLEDHISKGKNISNKEILKFVLEPSGMTVAHKLAFRGDKLTDKEILMLTGDNRTKENSLYGHNGSYVAFIMAKKGHFFEDPEVLKLGSSEKKSTVAHAMAAHKFTFSDPKVLNLKDDKGTTVAHIMATNGHNFKDEEILNLTNDYGFSVRDFQSLQSKAPALDA